ncbi:hypothetical protein DRJ24_03180 [Candidatus Acetothermia bacterium]|nr:MAG: hypothetical protein DRJ24_03180 [Candidatus Acetothermia bacterium]HHK67239.1 hypothetical protein [Candidatus Acetothermia bacterium]
MAEEGARDRHRAGGEGMSLRYKEAVERVISHLPVKNGVVDIDSIWIETSLPYTLLDEILRREDLKLPENVERINLTSRVRRKGKRSGKTKRR